MRMKNANFWLSKPIFYVKNYPNLSKTFFHWRISFKGHVFCHWKFLKTSKFKAFLFPKILAIFCQLNLEFWEEIWKWLKGHFWSVAKVELRIWCGTWNLNLESYLLHNLHKLSILKMRKKMGMCKKTWLVPIKDCNGFKKGENNHLLNTYKKF